MMRKDVIKSLIVMKQHDIPFEVKKRELTLPLDRAKIVTLAGVRRCGKSTLMELAINELIASGVDRKRILWLGFDDERLISMQAEDLDEVIQAYMELFPKIDIKDVFMFFDEIQLIKGWEYFVLRLFKSYCKNIFVCGSNATMLSTELCTALRGYPLEFKVYPLSFKEYCSFNDLSCDDVTEQGMAALNAAFDVFLAEGAFPEAVLIKSKSKRIRLLQGYFDTMLLKDLCQHYAITNTRCASFLVKRLMENLTKPSSINAVYGELKSLGLKILKDDLYAWAGYLCEIFLLRRIPKYERSLNKEVHSLYKYYCVDNGLRSAVLLPRSDDFGKNLENAVFWHLQRHLSPMGRISYYKGKSECDFVVEERDEVSALYQVCWELDSQDTKNREIRGLLEASSATSCKNLFIVTRDEEDEIRSDEHTIKIIPAWKWMLQD